MKPVQNARGRRRQWSSEQKLTVLQEWQTEVPLGEICWKYAVNAPSSSAELATAMGRNSWIESLNAAARASGATSPVSNYAALMMGPADAGGTAPAVHIRHWAMALDQPRSNALQAHWSLQRPHVKTDKSFSSGDLRD
jgi:hypothetical protein